VQGKAQEHVLVLGNGCLPQPGDHFVLDGFPPGPDHTLDLVVGLELLSLLKRLGPEHV
jgi:hypothetical protein